MKIAVINPNTTQAMTGMIGAAARRRGVLPGREPGS